MCLDDGYCRIMRVVGARVIIWEMFEEFSGELSGSPGRAYERVIAQATTSISSLPTVPSCSFSTW